VSSVIAPTVASIIKQQRRQDDELRQIKAELADVRRQLIEVEARHALDRRVAALERAVADPGPPAAISNSMHLRRVV
jgi:hypothetical protein